MKFNGYITAIYNNFMIMEIYWKLKEYKLRCTRDPNWHNWITMRAATRTQILYLLMSVNSFILPDMIMNTNWDALERSWDPVSHERITPRAERNQIYFYIIFSKCPQFFFSSLKWWMLKKQRIHNVEGSALEKTCWDENVQLKWLYDLFVPFCVLLISA